MNSPAFWLVCYLLLGAGLFGVASQVLKFINRRSGLSDRELRQLFWLAVLLWPLLILAFMEAGIRNLYRRRMWEQLRDDKEDWR